jgi:hypothetical protein
MFNQARNTLAVLGALGALALGGSALAGAADSTSTTSSSSSAATTAQNDPRPPGGQHVGRNGKQEALLSGDAAAAVKAAAEAKLPGGTVERVETDADHGSPYEAHVTKSDGTQVEVLINKDFEVTAVNAMGRP